MIDMRDISYTEGDPLSPHVGGEALPTADPFPDIPSGGLISGSDNQPDYPDVTIQSPVPLPLIGQFPYIEFQGIAPVGFGVVPIQDLLLPDPDPNEVIIYPSPIIPISPSIGDEVSEEAIESMDDVLGETPGTPFPVIDPITLPKLPDVTGWLGDIGEMLKGALPWLLLIGAGYLLLRRK